jgi:hypothetical protein
MLFFFFSFLEQPESTANTTHEKRWEGDPFNYSSKQLKIKNELRHSSKPTAKAGKSWIFMDYLSSSHMSAWTWTT